MKINLINIDCLIDKIRNYPVQKLFWFFLIFYAVFLCANNAFISLWDQDEGAYALFAHNILKNGNWLIPDGLFSDIHRKPPLHFWLIALCFKLFGENEFAVRLPSTFSIILMFLFIFYNAEFLGDKLKRLKGLLICGSIISMSVYAKISFTDGLLLLETTVCGISLIQILNSNKIKWVLYFWLGFSLALLTKGPPIIIFCAILFFLLFIFHPQRLKIFRLRPWFFLIPACLPFGLWLYLISLEPNGKDFIIWLYDWYIRKRISGGVLGQTAPVGSHLLMIIVFFLPYIIFIPKVFASLFSELFRPKHNQIFLLSVWFISGWLIYEFTPSKLPSYVLAAHIPLAFGIVSIYENSPIKKIFYFYLQLLIIFIFYFGITFGLYLFLNNDWSIIKKENLISLITIQCVVFIFMFLIFNQKYKLLKIIFYAFFQLIFLWYLLIPTLQPLKDQPYKTAQFIKNNYPKVNQILIANTYGEPPSLIFYLYQEGYENIKILDNNYLQNSNDTLWAFYTKTISPALFILNRNQLNYFLQNQPNLIYKSLPIFQTDRKTQDLYFFIEK